LEQDLKRQKLKNQVAQALLDLQRKADRGQKLPGGKKTGRKPGQPNATDSGCPGPARRMAPGDDS